MTLFDFAHFQNGSLLTKHTYLSNESSYSVFQEDGVDIIFLENNFPHNVREHPDHREELSYASDASDCVQTESRKLQSFSFETQVSILSWMSLAMIILTFFVA